MLEIGKFFLGTPYVTGTLETEGAEHLVVNLREYDCVTFVENVVALVYLVKSQEKSFKAFRRLLRRYVIDKGGCRAILRGFIIFQTGFMITKKKASSGMSQQKSWVGL